METTFSEDNNNNSFSNAEKHSRFLLGNVYVDLNIIYKYI